MKVKCPTCQTPVQWEPEQKHKPFCSKRCQLIDLGDWIDEKHRIPGDDATHVYSGPDDDDLSLS